MFGPKRIMGKKYAGTMYLVDMYHPVSSDHKSSYVLFLVNMDHSLSCGLWITLYYLSIDHPVYSDNGTSCILFVNQVSIEATRLCVR